MGEFHKYCPLTFCQETPYLGKNNDEFSDRFPGYLLIYQTTFTWGSFLNQRDVVMLKVRSSLSQELHSRSPFLRLDLLKLGARRKFSILTEILESLSLLEQGA